MSKLARVGITMEPEKKQRLQAHAEHQGESLNAFMNRAAEETMQHDNEKQVDRGTDKSGED